MTKPVALACTLLLLFSTVGVVAQESGPMTVQQAVEEFGSVLQTEEISLVVIHLNDHSIEALFSTAPNKEQLQTQAGEATMFFIQGTNGADGAMQPNLEWVVSQGGEEIATRPVNISNFEEGSEVPAGERYSGLVVADQVVDVSSGFSLQNGDHQFDFAFSESQIAMIAGS